MNALEMLNNYVSKPNVEKRDSSGGVFDTTTESGFFLEKLNRLGLDLYKLKYTNRLDGRVLLDTETYKKQVTPENEDEWVVTTEYTELYKVLMTDGNAQIDSIAGSGKTTGLVLKTMYDLVSNSLTEVQNLSNGLSFIQTRKIWVATFLRTGAFDLEKAFKDYSEKLGYALDFSCITFSTLDAEFRRALISVGVNVNIGSEQQLFSLFKKAVDNCKIKRKTGSFLSAEDYNVIKGMVVRSRGILDETKYVIREDCEYTITGVVLKLLIDNYAELRKKQGIMDFEQVQETLYSALNTDENNSELQKFIERRYSNIYVDEFQDTSQIQYAILRFYARGYLHKNLVKDEPREFDPLYTGEKRLGKMVVMGDISQCIYTFKGSDLSILGGRFELDFRPTLCTLSTNWRCPQNILEPIIPSIHRNSTSANQKILPAKPGGAFYCYQFSNYDSMLEQLKEDIEKDVSNNRSVGILCRTNFNGMLPALMLELSGFKDFGISSNGMTLSTKVPRQVLSVAKLLTSRGSKETRHALSYFLPYHMKWKVKQLTDTMRLNDLCLWNIPERDIEYSCPEVLAFVRKIKSIILDENGKRIPGSDLVALKYMLNYLVEKVYKGHTSYDESVRSYVKSILYILESNKDSFKSVYDFQIYIDQIEEQLEGRVGRTQSRVQIATVHEFKGKEKDSIYIWDDSLGVFPSTKCDLDFEEDVEEERRVHYIACTRAKKVMHIYTLRGRVGMFVKEMDLQIQDPKGLTFSF